MIFLRFVIATTLVTGLLIPWSASSIAQERAWGKSHHGWHHDQGPRSQPWRMEGIGQTHFPVTSQHPEVQAWFDQGHTLLHGFWFFEAERAFRWCIKLDPDCAMAYWGLARCSVADQVREKRFFREALKRKENLTPRELAYLDLWQAKYEIEGKGKQRKKGVQAYVKLLDNLLIDYPDDMEARALYWLELLPVVYEPGELGKNPMRYAMDRVLQEVLAEDPNHVGALHYRVHNWDGEEGRFALDTCLHLSTVAPECGHLLHMPGHVLSSIGLWHEAAIAMDRATRVEKAYMQQRMILPEQNWDYIHNLDYLSYIQEQLGMAEAAAISCQQRLNGPPSTELSPFGDNVNWSVTRLLVKFEKWDELLDEEYKAFRWAESSLIDPPLKSYGRVHALIGLGRLDEAEQELANFESKLTLFRLPKIVAFVYETWLGGKSAGTTDDDSGPLKMLEEMIAIRVGELRGKLALARGDTEKGIQLLTKAAELQFKSWRNDPPTDSVFLYNTLGETYLTLGRYEEAKAAFEKTLEKVIRDGFALSGLVVACHGLGQPEEAANYMGQLQAVWSNADQPNRWLVRAKATGVEAAALPSDLLTERNYWETVLDVEGHSLWESPAAPELRALNSDGQPVTLADFRGKNVILIFYLGGECLHCMEQMQEASRLAEEFRGIDTEILAVSKDDLATIRSYESPELKVTLLSDREFENARRFRSFDDFEEIELHSTILIDPEGRVHWSQFGGDPFMDFEFLQQEVRRLNARRHFIIHD